jgi:biopolymer transport protein ExbD
MSKLKQKLRSRKHRAPPELDITAFMNLMVALVPFLLVTAVFSRISILELDLPAAVGEGDAGDKQISVEVIVRKDRIEIGDGTQIVTRIGNLGDNKETYDFKTLGAVLLEIKGNYPGKQEATVLMEPDLEYDLLVQIMDTVSIASIPNADGKPPQKYELFPAISVGDAPLIEG